MNKAFIKEPEQGSANCPRCGSLGIGVTAVTLAALLKPEAQRAVASEAFFCPLPTCEVAYFDDFERFVTTDALVKPVYPKDPAAPICPCFGVSTDVIDADLAEGGVERVRALVQRAKGPEARCESHSPAGQSCVGEVQRYFLKRRGT